MKITYLGHAFFLLEDKGVKICIDPFINGNKLFTPAYKKLLTDVDYIFITHAHGDHIGGVLEIYNDLCKEKKPTIISNFEICSWLASKGIDNLIYTNIGGNISLKNDIYIKIVPAVHSSSINDNGQLLYGGVCSGVVVISGDTRVYHMGDTSVSAEINIIDQLYKPNVSLIPVGGVYTMDIPDAEFVTNNMLHSRINIPMHYDTFDSIAITNKSLLNKIKNVKILAVGESVKV